MEGSLIRTTCPYCGVGCGLRVAADETFSGDADHPANYGRLCSKGAALGDTLATDGRLLYPQIGGRNASWDEALDRVAASFTQTVADHGPDAVALYVSGQFLTEDYYVANKLMKGFIGSANIDTNSRLCMASSVAGHIRAFGEDIVPGCYDDIEAADLAILVGSNTAWCHPVLYQRLVAAREKRGTKVVTIDPRHTPTCDIADIHLAIRSGSDVAVFAGLLVHLVAKRSLRQGVDGRVRVGFRRCDRGCTEVGAVTRRRCGNRGCPGSRSGPLLRLVRRNRTHRDLLFPGHQPVLIRDRQGQRDHQLPSCDRPPRAARNGAVFFDRPAERDGRPRGRGSCQPARGAYELRRPGRRRSRTPLLERISHGDAARSQGGRPVRCGTRRQDQGAVDSQYQSGRQHAARRARARGAWRLPVCRRQRLLADRYDVLCRYRSAGGGVGREGRHGHQFGTLYLPAARLPAAAGRSSAGLVDVGRGGAAHGLANGVCLSQPGRDFPRARCIVGL